MLEDRREKNRVDCYRIATQVHRRILDNGKTG
jgi:hypothetical protein